MEIARHRPFSNQQQRSSWIRSALLWIVLVLVNQCSSPPVNSTNLPAVATRTTLTTLTPEERAWLNAHPIISTASDPAWKPIEFFDQKHGWQGITHDYMKLLGQRLGITLEPVQQTSWQQVIPWLKRRKIDIVTCIAKTPQREVFSDFTEPYLSIPIVILTQANVSYIAKMAQMNGKKVAVVGDYAIHEWIQQDHPKINLVTVSTITEGLKRLEKGEVFAYIDNMLVINQYTAHHQTRNVKIAGQTPYRNEQRIAVRNDWPILAGILQKALDDISDAEHTAIYQRWVPLHYKKGFDYAALRHIVVLFTIILTASLLWNWQLKHEIQRRQTAEAALRKSEARLTKTMESVPEIIHQFQLYPDGSSNFPYVSAWCQKMFGVSPQTLREHSSPLFDMILPEDRPRIDASIAHSAQTMTTLREEFRLYTANGEVVWHHGIAKPERQADGSILWSGILLDITECKWVEEALHREQEFIRTLLENMSDGVVACNAACELVLLNRTAREWHNLDLVQIPQKQWSSYYQLYKEDGQTLLNETEIPLVRAYQSEQVQNANIIIKARGQAPRYVTCSCVPFYDNQARLLGAVAVMRDLTVARRTELALKASERRFRQMVESAPIAISICNTLGEFEYINPMFQRTFGYSIDEIAEADQWFQKAYPDTGHRKTSQTDWLQLIAEVAHTQQSGTALETMITCRDGSLRIMEIFVAPMGNSLLAVFNDLTERQRAEKQLQESENKYRELVENANSIILRWNCRGKITFINEFGLRFFGYTQEELIGQHILGTIVPWDESADRGLHPIMKDICQNPVQFEHTINENIRRDGTRIWISWTNKTVLDNQDQVTEIFSIGSDITAQKHAEDALAQHQSHLEELVAERTAKLRQAMDQLMQSEKLAALGNLVAGVTHELSTPLGNTRIMAGALGEHLRTFTAAIENKSQLQRDLIDAFLEKTAEAIDLLERNATRAAAMINHFKQVAVDQTSMRRRPFQLRQTIEELLITLKPQFKHTAHHIELDIPAELELESYPGSLEQVLASLIGNSITHGFANMKTGRITIKAQAIGSTQVELHYTDNGVGISPDNLKRIFEPFFTTRLGQGGSGLGLYIVYNLVTNVLGGTIQVDSPPDHNLAFTLSLPRIAPDPSTLGMPT